MKITTKDIIKALPLDDQLKNNLIENFQNYDSGKQFFLTEVLWEFYDTLYEMKLEENTRFELSKGSNSSLKRDEIFFKKIREMTDKEMQDELEKTLSQVDIETLRTKLHSFAKETDVKKRLETLMKPKSN